MSWPHTGRRCALSLVAALALSLALAACAPDGGTLNSPPADTLQVGTALASQQVVMRGIDAGAVRSLDPSIATDIPAERVLDDIFEGLTRLDQSGEPAPGLATHWETSADGRIWTFHLRTANWSNGVPIKASDIVYAWRRTCDPRTASDYGQALAAVVNAVAINEGRAAPDTLGIEAPDEHTVVVRLNAPTPYLLSLLTKAYAYPQYAPVIAAQGENWTLPAHIVSNGAFVLREHLIGGRITLAEESALLECRAGATAESRISAARSCGTD